MPLHALGDKLWTMELFRGPTSAFKDVALSDAAAPDRPRAKEKLGVDDDIVAILDRHVRRHRQGGAARASADVPGTKIIGLLPPRRRERPCSSAQMATQAGENVCVCAVRGNFDDAQTGVKKIFSAVSKDQLLEGKGVRLSSANSINIGRLAPQVVYYYRAYADLVQAGRIQPGDKVDYVVPTGNFGDILAGYFAKEMGLPVGKLVCASNANNVLTDFLRTGRYDRRRSFYTTVSPSMDILVSSDLERLLYLCPRRMESGLANGCALFAARESTPSAKSFSDFLWTRALPPFSRPRRERRASSRAVWEKKGYLADPHTAAGLSAAEQYRREAGKCAPRSRSPRPRPSSSPRRCSLRSAKMCRKTALPALDALCAFAGTPRDPRAARRAASAGRSGSRPWSIKTKCANP